MLLDDDFIRGLHAPVSKSTSDFFDPRRKAWHSQSDREARCDFHPDRWRLNSRGILFISLWKASLYGKTLSDIKQDPIMPDFFAENISEFITRFFRVSALSALSALSAIVTPPPRRHLENNFAQQVARKISDRIGLPFHPDLCAAKSRQRIGAEFSLIELPSQPLLIVFDDIVTTGATFQAMDRLLRPHNKALIFIAGIDNS